MGGCHGSQILPYEPTPKGQCLCGTKVFGKVFNHTSVEHELARIILNYHIKKRNIDNNDLGPYIWTLHFIKGKFKNNCVPALLGMEDYPPNIFPQGLLNVWGRNKVNNVYSSKRIENFLYHTI
jgi:hypothetical protein